MLHTGVGKHIVSVVAVFVAVTISVKEQRKQAIIVHCFKGLMLIGQRLESKRLVAAFDDVSFYHTHSPSLKDYTALDVKSVVVIAAALPLNVVVLLTDTHELILRSVVTLIAAECIAELLEGEANLVRMLIP